ncbi:MAG: DUF2895 family protein [Neisseriaceae bacterium]|nr:DUF2895 family protein [Neisseriaceae bacterium]MBR3425861.1 DUF2895 family protein [Neisseriaceae bacterium]
MSDEEKSRLSQFLDKLTYFRKKMRIKAFGHSWRDSENAKTVFMLISVLLLVVVILQQVKINSQHERLVIVPPQMTKEARIAWDSSNANYVSDFSLYLATQISSITPKNVDYIIGAMEAYFHPQIWQSLKPQLLAIRDNPNFFGLNAINQFTPTGGVIFEPETGKTFVVGELRSSAYGKQGGLETLGIINATYEMRLAVNNGLPKVMEWYVYQGSPLTQEFRSKKPAEYDKAMAERQVSPLPMVTDSQIQRESTQNTITMTLQQPQQAVQQSVQPAQPQVEIMQPSALPNSQEQQQPVQAVQAAPAVQQPTQQQVLDPFSQAAQQANQATQPQQAAAPAVVLPNGQTQDLPQMNMNVPPTTDDDTL